MDSCAEIEIGRGTDVHDTMLSLLPYVGQSVGSCLRAARFF